VQAGIGGGAIRSDFRDDSGSVFVTDARLSLNVQEDSEVHLAVRHEELPRFGRLSEEPFLQGRILFGLAGHGG
jgi:hypothetical protein